MNATASITISAVDIARQLPPSSSAASRPGGTAAHQGHLAALFQQGLLRVLASDQHGIWQQLLDNADNNQAGWQSCFSEYFYDRVVGPYLTRHHALLAEDTDSVLALWQAAANVGKWLADHLWQRQPDTLRSQTPFEVHPKGQAASLAFWQPMDTHNESGSVQVNVRMDGVGIRFDSTSPWYYLVFSATPFSDEGQMVLLWLSHQQLEHSSIKDPMHMIAFAPEPRELTSGVRTLKKGAALFDTWYQQLTQADIQTDQRVHHPATPNTTLKIDAALDLGDFWPEWENHLTVQPAYQGPGFMRIPLVLSPHTTHTELQKLKRDLQNRLPLEHLPILHQEYGQWCLDIIMPSAGPAPPDAFVEFLASDLLQGSLLMGLNADLGVVLADLTNTANAHLLVAGEAGSGKRDWLTTALASLVSTNSPDNLRLVLIDSDQNTFRAFAASPYLLKAKAFHTDEPERIDNMLGLLLQEAEKRQRLLEELGVTHRNAYIHQTGAHMPLIICTCTEIGPLTQGNNQSCRAILEKIGQLTPATAPLGIYFIWVTDSQDRSVLQGPLARQTRTQMVFRMADGLASTLLLDSSKAADLAGRGDMFYQAAGSALHLQSLGLETAQLRRKLRA